MGKRGPKSSKNNLSVIEPKTVKRHKPLPGMTKSAREIWKRIVKAYPAEHFKLQHLDQLRGYCEAAAALKRAISKIEETGVIVRQNNGVIKQNPWCKERNDCLTTLASLGTKLGITVNATTVSRGNPGKSNKPKSKREGLMFGCSK